MLHVKIFAFNPLQENTYLVSNEEGDCIIIDPGCYDEAEREVLSGHVRTHNLRPALLLNTHCHLDHVFGDKFVAETWGLEPHFHALEQRLFELAPSSGLMWNLPFDSWAGPCRHIRAGEPLRLGKDTLDVLFTPGHSPGSVSLYDPVGGFVISGDVLFRGSIGRTDLPGGDQRTLERSIREVLYKLPDQTVVHSGHGPSTTIGQEKRHNPYVPALDQGMG
jgi:hydroxyacylglutathione hydrolase